MSEMVYVRDACIHAKAALRASDLDTCYARAGRVSNAQAG
jgi:hypothetical protein